jgi:hypothetical protein
LYYRGEAKKVSPPTLTTPQVNPFVKNLYQIGPKLLLKSVMVVMVPPRLSPSGNLELSRTWDYCFHNNNQAFWSKEKRLKKEKKDFD